MNRVIITRKYKRNYFLTWLLICCGLFPVIGGKFLGFLLLLPGLILLGLSYGIGINHANQKIRIFTSFYGYKYGIWQDLNNFHSLLTTAAQGRAGGSRGGSGRGIIFQLYLLSKDKSKSPNLLLDEFLLPEEMYKQSDRISDLLSLPIKNNKID